jgi:hypothetical protein
MQILVNMPAIKVLHTQIFYEWTRQVALKEPAPHADIKDLKRKNDCICCTEWNSEGTDGMLYWSQLRFSVTKVCLDLLSFYKNCFLDIAFKNWFLKILSVGVWRPVSIN